MKICFISEYFSPSYGGQFTSVKGIIDMCKLKNIDHVLIHKKSKIYTHKNNLEKAIKKCDIVHIFGGWTLFYVKISLLSLKYKKKTIVHPMGFYEPWSLSQKRIKKYFAWKLYQKNLLNKSNLVHCASVNEEKSLKKLNNKVNTVVLPFGIDKKNIVKTVNIKLKKKVLFFSRMHKKKGLDKLIQAWNSVNNAEWKLDIIGYGDQKYYKKLLNNKKLKVKFYKPFSSEKKKFQTFNKYDFLILPTANENFGIVILEALSRGLPVLTTNETPWSNIQEKNAGWIINNSLDELKLILNQIFNSSNKELIKKKRNTLKIANLFHKHKLSKLYLKTYKKLLSS